MLRILGERIKRERLNQNLTQGDLAASCGVGRRTLVAMESGASASMDTWLSVLRGLGRLAQLDGFLPEPPPSPVQLAKLQGRVRQRARGRPNRRAGDGRSLSTGAGAVAEDAAPGGWTWGD